MGDPLPLSGGQLWALLLAAFRHLSWGQREVSRELRRWRSRAEAIPDEPIRQDALETLHTKRPHIVGAALFAILPPRRDARLLRLLVAYEVMLEFLDNASERVADRANGAQLHLALVEALDPSAPTSDYYRHHPWKSDGGYLLELVQTCRSGCVSLPFYGEIRRLLLQGASHCGGVQSLNHETDGVRRGAALRAWAAQEFPQERETSWWELSAAASSSLGVHALLAVAASERHDWARVHAAYVPWACAVSTMLDSYVDDVRDKADREHSYIGYYPSREVAVGRVSELISRTVSSARGLPGGERHAVIAACMIAMYLSNDRARDPAMRASTDRLARAGGSLTRLLLPVLRVWRTAYAQRSN